MYESVRKSRDEVERPTQVATILDPDLYEALATRASQNERSIAAELRVAVKTYLKEAA